MAQTFFTGADGGKVEVALLPLGSRVEPTRGTITANGAAAKDITAPASITVDAIASGILIPANSYLGFTDPITGKLVSVKVTADAEATDTTITLDVIPETIADNSTAPYPLVLSGRTQADFSMEGNVESIKTFDTLLFEQGRTTSASATIECSGLYLPGDAGLSTVEYAFLNNRQVFVWVTLPKPSSAYSTGKVFKAVCNVSNYPVSMPADGAITADITFTVDGDPIIVEPVPAP